MGTGCLIQTNILITCLHVLWNSETNEVIEPEDIKVFIGQNGEPDEKMIRSVQSVKHNQDYYDKKSKKFRKEYDYAILLLEPQ